MKYSYILLSSLYTVHIILCNIFHDHRYVQWPFQSSSSWWDTPLDDLYLQHTDHIAHARTSLVPRPHPTLANLTLFKLILFIIIDLKKLWRLRFPKFFEPQQSLSYPPRIPKLEEERSTYTEPGIGRWVPLSLSLSLSPSPHSHTLHMDSYWAYSLYRFPTPLNSTSWTYRCRKAVKSWESSFSRTLTSVTPESLIC